MRIATYARISTDEDNQPFSLGAQQDRLDAYLQVPGLLESGDALFRSGLGSDPGAPRSEARPDRCGQGRLRASARASRRPAIAKDRKSVV